VAYAFSTADVDFLRSPSGEAALSEVAGLPLTEHSRIADVHAARAIAGERASAVLETAMLRRRAGAKLAGAGEWLLTDIALQQASASRVAAHRAARLAGADVHDVTCSVGADLVAIAGVARHCLGSDTDPVRLAMARHNVRDRALLMRADALRPVSTRAVVFADPARRAADGRRRWRPEDLRPRLDDLLDAYPGRPKVVKSAPGMDFSAVPWADEVEVVSLDATVREACLWTGEMATARRRASVLRADGSGWSVTDAEPDDCGVREPGEWIVDPDGAVVRAGLVRQYAARHSLGQLDERIAYLTGDSPPPGVRSFRVIDSGRYGEKALRAALRRHDAGSLEILARGVDVRPDELRKRLRPTGSRPVSLLLTRIGSRAVAFLCEPVWN
jgi:hypothetical protein